MNTGMSVNIWAEVLCTPENGDEESERHKAGQAFGPRLCQQFICTKFLCAGGWWQKTWILKAGGNLWSARG